MPALELIRKLEYDPNFGAAQPARELERQRKAAEWRESEAPLVGELRSAGYDVTSAWDLVNTSTPYPDARPILLAHLQRDYPDRVREGIARALAVRDARFGWDVLTRLYQDERSSTDAKDGLAVAITAASDDEVIDDVIALARDKQHGESRLLLLRALARSKQPRARVALEELERDPELAKEVRRIFHRLK